MTVPIFALLGTALYAISHEREGAFMGVILSVMALLVLWALVWGALWIVTGFRSGSFVPPLSSAAELTELRRENAMLKELLAEQARTKKESG